MAASEGLGDAEWQVWEGFFPPERGRVGQPAKVPKRLSLDALPWMIGEGARWRALPERFGAWNTVWRRSARWRDQGVFEAAFAAMAGAGLAKERLQMRDSAAIRAHQQAAGAQSQTGQRSPAIALGRSRGGFSTKLHIRADGRGLPLAFAVTGSERHDLVAVPELLDGVPLARTLVVADRSYDADHLRSHLLMRGAWPVIPGRRHRREPVSYDAQVYRARNRVERLVSKLKQFRRVATRYDQTAKSFLAFVNWPPCASGRDTSTLPSTTIAIRFSPPPSSAGSAAPTYEKEGIGVAVSTGKPAETGISEAS